MGTLSGPQTPRLLTPPPLTTNPGSAPAALAIFFNISMETMKLPESWKGANVTPLHKKGPKNLAENYRPIGLTSIVCKMDKFIRDCILDHMERHNLFTTHQHGFRIGRSCVTQLIEVLDDWTEQLDNRNAIDTIYLDFQKAFRQSHCTSPTSHQYTTKLWHMWKYFRVDQRLSGKQKTKSCYKWYIH